ncbi:MAG TPA: oligosaccharide flippase family protein, partial [Baekduia sp.]|nr:oligosaccharide flippase family protein [Baekduia sp.]
TSLGLEQAAVREAASQPERARQWVSALLVTRLLLTIPVMIAGAVAVIALQESHAMLIAGLILVAEFPFGVGSSLAVVHQLEVNNKIPMAILTANSVLWGICVVVVSVTGGGLIALAASFTAVSTVTATLQGIFAWRVMPLTFRPPRATIKSLIRVGAPLGAAGLLIVAYARIDQIIVFEQAGAQAAGFYGSAYRILEQVHFVPGAVITTIAPIVAALWLTDRERMLRVATLAAELLAIGSLGGLAFAIVGADPFMRLIFGDEFAPAAQALPVLAGAFVFICFGYLVANLLLVVGLAKRQIVVGLVALALNVAGNLILVPKYGFMAAAWMTLATELVVVGLGFVFLVGRLGRDSLSAGRLPQIAVAAVVLLGTLELVDTLGGGLAPLVAVSVLVYPALLLGLKAVSVGEVRDLVARRGA